MEKALEADRGNLKDTIGNSVYHLQKYMDFFQGVHNKNKEAMLADQDTAELYTFLVFEGNDILKDKILRLAIDMIRCVDRKRLNIKRAVEKEKDKERFAIYKTDIKDFIQDTTDFINQIEGEKYRMKRSKLYEERFDDLLKFYMSFSKPHNGEKEEVDYETLTFYLDEWYVTVSKILSTIYENMKRDSSIPSMIQDARYVIVLMSNAWYAFGAFSYIDE